MYWQANSMELIYVVNIKGGWTKLKCVVKCAAK